MASSSQDDGSRPIRSRFADDPGMVELVFEFVDAMPGRAESLRSALAKGDADTLVRLAHQLRGASGGYGFAPLGEVAGRVEATLRSMDADASLNSVRGVVDELIAACERVRR